MSDLIVRDYDGFAVYQRRTDRYLNATSMCKANGRLWADYWRNQSTQEFVRELSSVMGMSITDLVETRQGGMPQDQGTWVHPQVALHLGQWLSPRFAVLVTRWVEELLTTGTVSIATLSPLDILKQQVRLMEEQERRIGLANQTADMALAKAVAVEDSLRLTDANSEQANRLAKAAVDIHTNNSGRYTVLGWCRLNGYSCDIKLASIHGRKLSKICRAAGLPLYTQRDPRWGEVNSYPEDVLERYFNETEDK